MNTTREDSSVSPVAASASTMIQPSIESSDLSRFASYALWPAAIVLFIHRVFFLAFNGARTDDFTTVYSALRRFLTGESVYDQAYNHVDPLYLYNPGATLLLSPLGMLNNAEFARAGFILVNAVAIIIALALMTRMVGYKLTSPVFPASVVLAFLTESVENTLVFSNINGLLLLALACFLRCLNLPQKHFLTPTQSAAHRARHNRGAWLAGIAIGLAIIIKPQFAPLLFIPLVTKQWQAVVGGAGLPLVLNAIAWPLIPGASEYFSKLVPYLKNVRDYANSSLPGFAEYFAMPRPLYWLFWLAAATAVGTAIVLLLHWRNIDRVLWTITTSSTLLVGIFFLSSLGQQYYSMWLFPLLFTVLLQRSVMHSWPAWLASILFLAPLSWASDVWPTTGKWLSFFTNTVGWGLLIAVICTTVVVWFVSERKIERYGTGRQDSH